MLAKSLLLSALLAVTATQAWAQGDEAPAKGRVELSLYGGGEASSGYDADVVVVSPTTGVAYNGIGFKSGAAYGASAGYYVNPNMEVELGWIRQNSTFQGKRVDGADNDDFMDTKIDQFQGFFIYNFYDDSRKVRPFAGLGLGATVFTPDQFQGRDVKSQSFFAGTLTGGIKAGLGKTLGVRLQGRVTPTYIKSSTTGYWCGWGTCWPVETAHYVTQFGLTAGVNLRFGPALE